MGEKRHRVPPITNLPPAQRPNAGKSNDSDQNNWCCRLTMMPRELRHRPDRGNTESDAGDQRVTVSHSLLAGLDDSDHRNESTDEPEPANPERRTGLAAKC